jgi:hypothetical protein
VRGHSGRHCTSPGASSRSSSSDSLRSRSAHGDDKKHKLLVLPGQRLVTDFTCVTADGRATCGATDLNVDAETDAGMCG